MSSRNCKLLIIGPLPPPVGGVSVHVKRLTDHLKKDGFNFEYCSLDSQRIAFLLFSFKFKNIHLHTSNVYLRFFVSLYSYVFKVNLVITYHGDIGRFCFLKNIFDGLSLRFSSYPLVINEGSYEKARKINPSVRFVSAFIPPLENTEKPLPFSVLTGIDKIKCCCKRVFATNAYDFSYDDQGREIYGILSLLSLFREMEDFGLIVCDPSGNYSRYFSYNHIVIPENIFLINDVVSFYMVVKEVDGIIRNTVTDGDSLSVKEALSLNKLVFCTDVVSRPKGTILYSSLLELESCLYDYMDVKRAVFDESGYDDIKSIYNSVIK